MSGENNAFVRLVRALSPWSGDLVYIGGWAHRLYRLHPDSESPPHPPLLTLDADIAFARSARMEGNLKTCLEAEGFQEQLTGSHRPPVSQYVLGNEDSTGFYAEFLTPLVGRETTRQGDLIATVSSGGITAQRLRYLEVLLVHPWDVTLPESWGAEQLLNLRIPNPVMFLVQKLLIHERRPERKRAQDILYIHDTLELFGHRLDELAGLWREDLRGAIHENWVCTAMRARDEIFGAVSDGIRDAAATVPERNLVPERVRAMCAAGLGDLLG